MSPATLEATPVYLSTEDETPWPQSRTRYPSHMLTHVGVPIRNLEVALAFWHDKLGLSDAVDQPIAERVRWVEIGAHQFHLFENQVTGELAVRRAPHEPYGEDVPLLVFATPSLAAFRARVPEAEPFTFAFGKSRPALRLQDPNGYWFAVVEVEERGGEPGCISAFIGLRLPARSVDAALDDFQALLGFEQTSPCGIDTALGTQIEFVACEDAPARYGLGPEIAPPREFHLNFNGDFERAIENAGRLGRRTFEASVVFASGSGACQSFFDMPATGILIEVSRPVAQPLEICRTPPSLVARSVHQP